MSKRNDDRWVVLSLGGSLIVPNGGINIKFLRRFQKFIRRRIKLGFRFFITCGGGATARNYIAGGTGVCGRDLSDNDKDWLGIHSSRLNGHLLRTIFRDVAYFRVIEDYDVIDKRTSNYQVVVTSGWKPGWSTDYCATLIAQDYNIDTLINLSNIERVYDKDPDRYKTAKPLNRMSWDEVIKLVGKKWTPGLNSPFDPIASQLAKKIGLRVIVAKGTRLKNLGNILDNKSFVGTTIE